MEDYEVVDKLTKEKPIEYYDYEKGKGDFVILKNYDDFKKFILGDENKELYYNLSLKHERYFEIFWRLEIAQLGDDEKYFCERLIW